MTDSAANTESAEVPIPPGPLPAPRKTTPGSRWYALRDNVTRLYFFVAAVAVAAALVWLVRQQLTWHADDHLVRHGKRVEVQVYDVNRYTREGKRGRDQTGARRAHFVFPVEGIEQIRGTAMLPLEQIPPEGVGGKIKVLRL